MKTLNLHGTVIDADDAWFYDLLEIENINAKAVSEFLDQANGEDIMLPLILVVVQYMQEVQSIQC
ncbi:hypothetical protein [Lactococcus fujiensis]|uniref:hypothetical protein n=1 Tax=Lactococcus fujiensis TaxID=610251 RepID=UPI0006D04ED0|nr:hypothetical protein [Lactococcus fujiensis]